MYTTRELNLAHYTNKLVLLCPVMTTEMNPSCMSPGDATYTIWQSQHQYFYQTLILQFMVITLPRLFNICQDGEITFFCKNFSNGIGRLRGKYPLCLLLPDSLVRLCNFTKEKTSSNIILCHINTIREGEKGGKPPSPTLFPLGGKQSLGKYYINSNLVSSKFPIYGHYLTKAL